MKAVDAPRQIVVLVDHHACSLAAVDRAAHLAAGQGLPLVVGMLMPPQPALAGMSPVVPVVDHADLEWALLDGIAARVAPAAVRWDFRVLADGADVAAAWLPVERRRTLIVHADHGRRHRWFNAPRGRMARVLAAHSEGPPPLAVACGQAGPGGGGN
ncbi:hypothetical protein [Sphaerisporangium dianthi]|uniref:Universal stress protein n=1 Tax=Sphaerisporangium dianthi TaxID=1436120 RepID=A0ABV9CV86_9ACTN